MNVIPVIDLLDGQVVLAKLGDRKTYRAIHSTLCDSSKPIDILHAIFALYPFKTCYIADLNAIQKTGNHHTIIKDFIKAYPKVRFWVDGGFSTIDELALIQETGSIAVIGTESVCSIDIYEQLSIASQGDFILSLDYKDGRYTGPTEIEIESKQWPDNIIAMTLNRVGSHLGPDCQTLSRLKALSKHNNIYAAGGVRNADDLKTLKQLGTSGVLIASALHTGNISRKDLTELTG